MSDFDDLQPDLDPPDMAMPSKSSRTVRVHVRPEGTESTSAALRRVEQERDQLLAFLRGTHEIAKDRNGGQAPDKLHLAYEREMARLRVENERLRATEHDRDLARAEMASARTELDAVRTARDNLGRELAEARLTIRALTARTDLEAGTS